MIRDYIPLLVERRVSHELAMLGADPDRSFEPAPSA